MATARGGVAAARALWPLVKWPLAGAGFVTGSHLAADDPKQAALSLLHLITQGAH
jgi:hypothetical protein